MRLEGFANTSSSSATSSSSVAGTRTNAYQDYAKTRSEEDLCLVPCMSQHIEGLNVRKKRNSFPEVLHYALKEMEKDGLDDIASWQPHGRCFVVRDIQRFEKDIIPSWFQQSKIASFQRQLNIYGFKRIPVGRDKGGYYHELFLRGKSFLAKRIQRTKVKGKGPRRALPPEDLPDLYSYTYLPETKTATSGYCGLPTIAGSTRTTVVQVAATNRREESHRGREEEQRASLPPSARNVQQTRPISILPSIGLDIEDARQTTSPAWLLLFKQQQEQQERGHILSSSVDPGSSLSVHDQGQILPTTKPTGLNPAAHLFSLRSLQQDVVASMTDRGTSSLQVALLLAQQQREQAQQALPPLVVGSHRVSEAGASGGSQGRAEAALALSSLSTTSNSSHSRQAVAL